MPRPTALPVPAAHLSALTGARFVAAFAVLLCHFGPQADWPRWLTAHGREAVAFFFVLSGFVLTYNYADRLPAGDVRAYAGFLRARFARIYPVHLLLLLASTFMMLWLYQRDPAWRPFEATRSELAVSWVQNALLIQSYFNTRLAVDGWNGVAWSVSCEATFYLAFPFVLARINRLQSPRQIAWFALASWLVTAGGLAGLCGVMHVAAHKTAAGLEFWTYHAPYLRLGEFVTGCLAGLWFVRSGPNAWPSRVGRETATWGGLAVGMTIAILQNYGQIPLLLSNGVIFTPAFAVAIVAVASGPTSLGWLLSGRALGVLGEASYSLYLLHVIPVVLLNRLSGGHPGTGLSVLAMLACVPASVLLYRTVEDPCRLLLRTRRPTARSRPVFGPLARPGLAAA